MFMLRTEWKETAEAYSPTGSSRKLSCRCSASFGPTPVSAKSIWRKHWEGPKPSSPIMNPVYADWTCWSCPRSASSLASRSSTWSGSSKAPSVSHPTGRRRTLPNRRSPHVLSPLPPHAERKLHSAAGPFRCWPSPLGENENPESGGGQDAFR